MTRRRSRCLRLALAGLLVLSAIRGARAITLVQGFEEQPLYLMSTGIESPVGFRFAADGRVFVAEKTGLLKVFEGPNDTTAQVVADLTSPVDSYWDRGLLALALHPDFPNQPYIYVFYTYSFDPLDPAGGMPRWPGDNCPVAAAEDGCVVNSRLSRLQVTPASTLVGTEQVLIENRWCQQYSSHSVGTLVFRGDGALCVSAGDGASFQFVDYGQGGGSPGSPTPSNPCDDPPAGRGGTQTPPTAEGGALRAQDLRTSGDPLSYDGAVLCVEPTSGAPWPTNPLVGGDPADDRVVAFGFRNPFRMTPRPGTNELWVGDVGWFGGEEIDRIVPPVGGSAQNFGWPCYEGNDRNYGYDAADLDICEDLYVDAADPARVPFFTYPRIGHVDPDSAFRCSRFSGAALTGLTFYEGTSYPSQFQGALFFSDHSRQCLWVMFPGPDGLPDPSTVQTFADGVNPPVDLQVDPATGSLCYGGLVPGSIRCIRYVEANDAPTAIATATPTYGPTSLSVQFDASGSSDPDPFQTLSYAWDLDGDGQFDDGTGVQASYVYTVAGQVSAAVLVTDEDGATDTATVTITAGNLPPTATILSPAANLQWSVGQEITFSGGAQDPEDGALPASQLHWQVLMHHCPGDCHTHLLAAFDGVSSGSFTAPDHEWYSYLEIVLTATDSGIPGLGVGQFSREARVSIDPATVELTFETVPSGLSLVVGGVALPTPFTRTVIAGSTNTISAPFIQQSYVWQSWSDGGTRNHEVAATVSEAWVATYELVDTTNDWVVVEAGSSMSYLANSINPGIGMSWTLPGFNDSAWQDGFYGVGYEGLTGAEALIATDVPTDTLSIFSRATFEIPDRNAVQNLYLGADYDDGYAVWLNGTEIYRSPQLPAGPLLWNVVPSSHESSNGSAPNYSPLQDVSTAAVPVLQNGLNVLAVGVWNTRTPASSDLVLVPQLTVNKSVFVTRGPYLQNGTPTSVVVRWRTDLLAGSQVLYGTSPDSLTSNVTIPGTTLEHSVQLSGLTPGTRYYYAVGSGTAVLAGGDANHFFVTPPLAGTFQQARIWVLGDSGAANQEAQQVRDAYDAFTGSRHTDLWLMLGDNAYPDGTDAEYQAALFDIYPEMLRRTVLWSTLGNHDALSAQSGTGTGPYYDIFTLPAAGEAGGQPSGTEAYYSFDYANVHFVVLNSQDVDRAPGSPMLQWLASDLASTAQDWTIALWHHPPYSHGSHNSDTELQMVEMRENVVPVLESYGIDLVLTGHSHSYERSFLIDGHYGPASTFGPSYLVDGGDGREDGNGSYQKPALGSAPHEGAVYLVAGTGSSVQGGSLDYPAMYLSLNSLGSVVLDLSGNRLDVKFLGTSGAILDHFTLRKGFDCPSDPDADIDGDTICGDIDNCPTTINVDQANHDDDGDGDACDPDDDNDSVPDDDDCAPYAKGVAITPQPIGPTLRLAKVPSASLRWARAPQGHTSNVYRGVASPGQMLNGTLVCRDAQNLGGISLDAANPPPGFVYYYVVTSRNACGESHGGLTSQGVPRVPAVLCPWTTGDFDGDGASDLEDSCPLAADSALSDLDLDFVGDVCDGCPSVADPGQDDLDADGSGNACDTCTDGDGDGFGNSGFPASTCATDNCPSASNASQANADADTLGDTCDSCPFDASNDLDVDGICGNVDNCPAVANFSQQNADGDGLGDVCDSCTDTDGDDFGNPNYPANTCALDNCPSAPNASQANADADAMGDVCDACTDTDGDGFGNPGFTANTCAADNCPTVSNASQANADADASGDVCDACTDIDGDGFGNPGFPANTCAMDNCPAASNASQANTDQDALGDACDTCTDADGDGFGNPGFPLNTCAADNCPAIANPSQANADQDASGDFCDTCTDTDGDGFGNPGFPASTCAADNCPTVSNISQTNADADAFGDVCDTCPNDPANDGDADGVCGNLDNCPTVPNTSQANADGDASGDACDTCTDTDGDGFGNPGFPASTCAADNCPSASNASQANADGDASGDACDTCTDTDGDGFGNPGFPANTCAADNCPAASNASQANADGDASGDACDTCTDTDGDGFGNPGFPASTCAADNCPTVSNVSQANADSDAFGDVCDTCTDTDGDGFGNPGFPLNTCAADNCPTVSNISQANADGDATGDSCDSCTDTDGDGFGNPGFPASTCAADNCPSASNASQANADGDAFGNACDTCTDTDGDGFGNPGFAANTCATDNCPSASNASQANADGDALGDACDSCTDTDGDGFGNPGFPLNTCGGDNCPTVSNASQSNADGDALGDACDTCTDTDGDGFGNPGFPANTCGADNCPTVSNSSQANADGDALGDACDTCTDTDGDGFGNPGFPLNTCGGDNCPTVSNASQSNADGDALGDACDTCTDTDGDGFGNPGFPANTCGADNCPTVSNSSQANADGDALGDVCDSCTDTDADGFGNPGFPLNTCPTDNCPSASNSSQTDTDADGFGNACDVCPFVADPAQLDGDGDGIGNVCDACPIDPYNDRDSDGVCGNVDNCPSVSNPDQADGDQDGIGDRCQFVMVADSFYIAVAEVTNQQFAVFLNAVADADPNGLFSSSMSSNALGGIVRSGSSGTYTYSTRPNMADKPVNFVSWLDATRYVNWMHNGRPSGSQGPTTTETGAYNLTTANPGATAVRSVGAQWFLPTKNEWDSAAFDDPDAETGQPWLYPTRSNDAPVLATATSTGDVANPGANVANYNRGAIWNNQTGNVTSVGGAGPLSSSYWGTYDQGGNVREWAETLGNASKRKVRGGSYRDSSTDLRRTTDREETFSIEDERIGFRIAASLLCPDADGDGYSPHGNPDCPGGLAADCDDTQSARHPGNPEICDGLDNDCSGGVPANELDDDGDGRINCADNCPTVSNASQANADGDALGDACDTCTDTDADGFGNPGFPANTCAADNCPTVSNVSQANADGDATGDACDTCTDTDADGFGNPGFPLNTCFADNCPTVSNASQANADGDALGDACDPCPNDAANDSDGDGVCGDVDNCPTVSNAGQQNADHDALGDLCDPCTDTDTDGFGDPGFSANTCPTDNCPDVSNPEQTDTDEDGAGDACDPG